MTKPKEGSAFSEDKRLEAIPEAPKGQPRGERRLVTILFADLSGFTALSSRLDPEEVGEAANISFEFLNKAILRHGGTIHKYEGDLVVALFGHPTAHEDDPERAIRASFEMFGLLPRINQALSSKVRATSDLGLHIGINSGVVVVGEVGAEGKTEYTVMGDAVNLGSRLKNLAEPGAILVSGPVFRASRYLFEYEVRDPVSVKGIDQPVKVYRPLREKEKPDPKRGIQGLHSPLVGRERELKLLQAAVGRLQAGNGGAVFVLGDAGLGKSRLVEELRAWIAQGKVLVNILEGRCQTYGETVPYGPFLQMLAEIFGITGQDTREALKDKLLKGAQDICPESWEEEVPYLGYLFSVRFEDELDEKIRHLDPQGLKVQILVSVRRLLAAWSLSRPLLLVIEDYHWSDTASLELLEFLFDSPEPFPMLLLALSRIEKGKESHRTKERLKGKIGERFEEIVLGPLDPGAGAQMVNHLLKIPGITAGFAEKVLAKAEGNPFYLEEIIRSLIDAQVLVFSSGVWRLASEVSGLEIPDTVQAVIASRLDRLEPEVQDVLQRAAVLGRNFYGRLLGRICGIDPLMLTLYLATLEEFEYISEARRHPEPEYRFRHPLLQETVYQGLLKKRRGELHRQAGEAIEALYPDRLEDLAELLAYQYVRSDHPEKALEWLNRAGLKAKERYANDQAIQFFQTLIALLEGQPGAGGLKLCAAYEALGDIQGLKGLYDQAFHCYEAIAPLASGDVVLQSRARRKRAEVLQIQGRYEEALGLLAEAEEALAGMSGEERLERAENYFAKCAIHSVQGDMEGALKEGEAGLSLIAAAPEGSPSSGEESKLNRLRVKGYSHVGFIFFQKGDYDRAMEFYRRQGDLARALGDKLEMGASSGNLGNVYYSKGDNDQAIAHYQLQSELFQEIGYKRGLGRARGNLASVYDDRGEGERATAILQTCLTTFEEVGDEQGMAITYGNLSVMQHRQGDYDAALASGQRQLRLSEKIGYKRGMVMAQGNLGNVYHDQGDYERARAYYEREWQLAQEIGFKRGMGWVCATLGILACDLNDWEGARERLVQAEAILKEVGDRDSLVNAYLGMAELASRWPGTPLPEPPLSYVDKAFKLAEELGSKAGQAKCYHAYGMLYAAQGKFPWAEINFPKAIKMFADLKQKKDLADACLDYARFLKKKGASAAELDQPLSRARALYRELKLPHMLKECEI